MKMTFELPADIVQRLKLKAAEEGLKLKDLLAEACRDLLAKGKKPVKRPAKSSPFPVLKDKRRNGKPVAISAEQVDALLWGPGK